LGALAAVEVVILLALIVATIGAFWRTSRTAALLLLPYLFWVAFASLLTWTVWRSNPGLL
jgi:tryptophan-rich sensory protein